MPIFESNEEVALIVLFVFRNYAPQWLLALGLSYPLLKFTYRHLHKQLTVDLDTELPNNYYEKYSSLINIPKHK